MYSLLFLLILVLFVIIAVLIYWILSRDQEIIQALRIQAKQASDMYLEEKDKNHFLLERVKKLEDMNSKRLNHKTAALMEEAIANLMVAKREREMADLFRKQEEDKRSIEDAALETAMKLVWLGRTDPHKLDLEKPGGGIER